MSYIAESVHRARGLGRTAEAALAWRELLTQTHVDEADLDGQVHRADHVTLLYDPHAIDRPVRILLDHGDRVTLASQGDGSS